MLQFPASLVLLELRFDGIAGGTIGPVATAVAAPVCTFDFPTDVAAAEFFDEAPVDDRKRFVFEVLDQVKDVVVAGLAAADGESFVHAETGFEDHPVTVEVGLDGDGCLVGVIGGEGGVGVVAGDGDFVVGRQVLDQGLADFHDHIETFVVSGLAVGPFWRGVRVVIVVVPAVPVGDDATVGVAVLLDRDLRSLIRHSWILCGL